MKFNLSLKYSHTWVIDELKEKHSVSSNEEILRRYIHAALELKDNDLIFGTVREQCGDGCFASEPQFEVDIDQSDFDQLKQIYKDYGFLEYATEEEEISKTIRCIIKFIEEKPELISI
tara:strand:- start:1216 stop:1569 length:354 start_codon:yes stop_codon:yes gene_type:complete